jgi:hypothetical protein
MAFMPLPGVIRRLIACRGVSVDDKRVFVRHLLGKDDPNRRYVFNVSPNMERGRPITAGTLGMSAFAVVWNCRSGPFRPPGMGEPWPNHSL